MTRAPLDLDACYDGPDGMVEIDGRRVPGPRYVFEAVAAESFGDGAVVRLRPGVVIHHLCGNRRCLNPRHMRPVRISKNRRG